MTDIENVVTEAGELEIPAVVAIVISRDPQDQFETMLQSLAWQDYENLSVLVVDSGSEIPIADRVAKILPAAYLHRMAGEPGWSVSANQAMDLVSGSPFMLFCHDDVALEPNCVSALMAEMYSSNAAIVGPKLVDWDDPRRLLQVGMASDRVGVSVDLIDKGEFDQQQYDTPRDVFYIPGGVQLIRADLLTAMGGFDPEISKLGEDLDLCWRAHALGARVVVVPKAKVRHKENLKSKSNARERRKILTRNRLRTVMSSATGKSMFTAVPLAVLLVIAESVFSLFTGRRKQARDVISAIPWNLSQFGAIRKRRKQLNKIRTVDAKGVRSKQVGGLARISDYWHNRFSASQDRLDSMFSSDDQEKSARDSIIIYSILAFLFLVSSRSLLVSGYEQVGQIPYINNGGATVREWLGGWRTAGTGGPGNSPTAYLVLGAMRTFFFWAPSLFEKLLIIAPLIFGILGANVLLKPFGSVRTRALITSIYLFNPVMLSIMVGARWDSLVVWATVPYLISSLLKIGTFRPYGMTYVDEQMVPTRTFPVRTMRYAVLVAFVATFTPSIVPVAIIAAVAFSIGAAFSGQKPENFVATAILSLIVPFVLHFPWSYDIAQSFSWDWLVGTKSSEEVELSILNLLQMRTSGLPFNYFGFVFIVMAIFGLIISKKKYQNVALAGIITYMTLAFALWLEANSKFIDLPAAESLLSVGLCALCLPIAAGILTLEYDLSHTIAKINKLYLTAYIGGFLIVLFFAFHVSFDGKWHIPTEVHQATVNILSPQVNSDSQDSDQVVTGELGRILWIGDESVLPADPYKSDLGHSYAITEGNNVDISSKWISGELGATKGIGDQLDLALSKNVRRLGSLLAPYGIDYVFVVDKLTPGSIDHSDNGYLQEIDQQLDLKYVIGRSLGLSIFSNPSSPGLGATFSDTNEANDSAAKFSIEQIKVQLNSDEVKVEKLRNRPGQWDLQLAQGKKTLIAIPNADNLKISGEEIEPESGFSNLLLLPQTSDINRTIKYPASNVRRIALVTQFFLFSSAVVVAQSRRGDGE